MQVLALQGSPRKKGNTEIVLWATLAPLRAAGAKVRVMRVCDMDVGGCIECFTCQKRADTTNCAVKDDVQKVYRAVTRADLILFATPVFCWGPTAQLKAVMDRWYAFCQYHEDGSYDTLLEGKSAAVVATAGGGPDEGADTVLDQCRRLADHMRMEWLGQLVCARLGQPERTRADKRLLTRARKFGEKLARVALAP